MTIAEQIQAEAIAGDMLAWHARADQYEEETGLPGVRPYACGQDRFGSWVGFNVRGMVFLMRWIPPGEFTMGSPPDEEGRWPDEHQSHQVISRGFWLGETPVTQELWEAVMGKNPSHFHGEINLPVESVSWRDCQEFIARLNELLPFAFRLPGEAEWEYACRAGTTGARYGGLDDAAWHSGNSNWRTHPVARKLPNAWGLYDMLGNVCEWCQDVYRERYEAPGCSDPQLACSGVVAGSDQPTANGVGRTTGAASSASDSPEDEQSPDPQSASSAVLPGDTSTLTLCGQPAVSTPPQDGEPEIQASASQEGEPYSTLQVSPSFLMAIR